MNLLFWHSLIFFEQGVRLFEGSAGKNPLDRVRGKQKDAEEQLDNTGAQTHPQGDKATGRLEGFTCGKQLEANIGTRRRTLEPAEVNYILQNTLRRHLRAIATEALRGEKKALELLLAAHARARRQPKADGVGYRFPGLAIGKGRL